jgi:hypothetical protein
MNTNPTNPTPTPVIGAPGLGKSKIVIEEACDLHTHQPWTHCLCRDPLPQALAAAAREALVETLRDSTEALLLRYEQDSQGEFNSELVSFNPRASSC